MSFIEVEDSNVRKMFKLCVMLLIMEDLVIKIMDYYYFIKIMKINRNDGMINFLKEIWVINGMNKRGFREID